MCERGPRRLAFKLNKCDASTSHTDLLAARHRKANASFSLHIPAIFNTIRYGTKLVRQTAGGRNDVRVRSNEHKVINKQAVRALNMQATTSLHNPNVPVPRRFAAHLHFNVSVCGGEEDKEIRPQGVTLIGYTDSVGDDTISLVAPFHQFCYRYLMGYDRTLQMELRLPTGPVSLQGFPTRYVMLSEEESRDGYMITGPDLTSFDGTDVNCLIEVSIVVMSEEHRALFNNYLSRLDQSETQREAQRPTLTLVRDLRQRHTIAA